MRKALVGVAALLIAWLSLAGVASAASLTADRTSVAAGRSVVLSGSCTTGSPGFVISAAFLHDAAHDFAGVGAVSFTADASGNFSVTATVPVTRAPGAYMITARCGGGNLGISLPLQVTAAQQLAFTGPPAWPALAAAAMVGVGLGLVAVSRRTANASASR